MNISFLYYSPMQILCHDYKHMLLFEQTAECGRYRCGKVHTFARYGVGETQHIRM